MTSKLPLAIEEQLHGEDESALRNSSQIGNNDYQSAWNNQNLHFSHFYNSNDQDQYYDQFSHQVCASNGGEYISDSTQYDYNTTQDLQFSSSGYSFNNEKGYLRQCLSSSINEGYQHGVVQNFLINKEDEQYTHSEGGENSMLNNPSMISSTNHMEEISLLDEVAIKSQPRSCLNQLIARVETEETPKIKTEQSIELQDSPTCHTQTRKRRQPLSQEKAKIKKQQESKNMINSIIHYVRLVKDAQKNLKLKKNCSLTQFVQKLVNLKKDEQQITKNLIKQYFFEIYSVHTLPNSKYIEDADAYPQYIEAFFSLLDFYTHPKFKQAGDIKSVPFKQFLNLS